MQIAANSIKVGNILVIEDELLSVIKPPEHIKPGKGPAYVQLELKKVFAQTKINRRLRSSDMVEKAQLNERKHQYLYTEGQELWFMDLETFEQIAIPINNAEEEKKFLTDGLNLILTFFQNTPMKIILPSTVILTIQYTSPNIKGATVAASYKKAEINSHLTVLVPPYLESGDKIIVKGLIIISPSDFKIEIPRAVSSKISNKIKVIINYELVEKK